MTADERKASEYNAHCTRDDIEWCASPSGGVYLRDKPGATERRTKDMAAAREKERRRWLWNFHNPIEGAEREPAMTDVGL